MESNGDGAGLIDSWAGRVHVILIDAVLSGSAPGTIHRLELGKSILPAEFFKFSTHLFSIPQAIYLSASLGNFLIKLSYWVSRAHHLRPVCQFQRRLNCRLIISNNCAN